MKNHARITLLAILGLFTLTVTTTSPSAALEPPAIARIGVVLPLSGPVAPIGESLKNGMLMARDELDPEHRTEFLFDDDSFQPVKAVPAAKRFLDVEKVSGLFLFGTGQGFAINQMAEQAKTPLIVIGIDPKITEGKSYVMRFFPSLETIHNAMRAEIRARGYKSLALVATSADELHCSGRTILAAVKARQPGHPADQQMRNPV